MLFVSDVRSSASAAENCLVFSSRRFQTWWLYTMDEEQAIYVPNAFDS